MIRGTSHIFRFDCSDIIDDITTARSFEVIFEQSNNNNSPIIKKFDVFFADNAVVGDSGCGIDEITKEIIVELTPEETILFMEDRKLKVQLKGVTADNSYTFADYIQYVTVYPMLPGQNSRAIVGGTSTYVLPVASANTLGGVKVSPATSNITMNNGLISVTSENVVDALDYTPADVVETVYVGEEAPTDTNIRVWVHPTEEDLSGGNGEATPIYNFIQITRETITQTMPSDVYSITCDIPTPVEANEILMLATGTSSYYAVLNTTSADGGIPTKVTFYRAPDKALDSAMGMTCYLTRLKATQA